MEVENVHPFIDAARDINNVDMEDIEEGAILAFMYHYITVAVGLRLTQYSLRPCQEMGVSGHFRVTTIGAVLRFTANSRSSAQ